MANYNINEDKITVEVETVGLEEMNENLEKAINNAENLSDALELPKLVIKQCKNCTFNIFK